MKQRLQAIFGVDKNGRPTFPNSRRQLLIAGLVCLAIWPGIGLALIAADQLDTSEYMYLIVNPFLVVTLLGAYVIGQALLADNERAKFKNNQQATRKKKESQK